MLDQIEHWCDFGAGIIVLEGPGGVGKTALLKELIRRCDDGALISQLDGPVLAGLDQMLMLLAAELGAELIEGQTSGAMLGHLRKHVKSASRPMFVFVDQAHNLDDRALLALIGLLQGQQPGEAKLNIITFAESGLADRLRKFDVADVIVNQKELSPLNESELSSYIHQQLASVDYDGPELFSDMELKELFKASRGIPAELDVLVQNLLINRLYSRSVKGRGFPAWHLIGVGALIAALGTAYIYRTTIQDMWQQDGELVAVNPQQPTEVDVIADASNTQAESSNIKSVPPQQEMFRAEDKTEAAAPTTAPMDDTENLINEALTPSEPLIEERIAEGRNQQLPQEEPLERAGLAPQDSLSTPNPSSDTTETSPVAQLEESSGLVTQRDSETEESPLDSSSTEELGADEEQAIALADVNELGDSSVDYSSYNDEELAQLGIDPGFDLSVFTEDEQYLLRLPDSAYVLQLISVRTAEQVEKFLRVQPNRDELKIFNRENGGKAWYVIVQPGFDTWESVQAAQERLPSRRRNSGAWARSLKIIKADIRSFRGI